MSNSPTPTPPLPFGSPATLPKELVESRIRQADTLNTITDLSNLVGTQVRSRLAIRGGLGASFRPDNKAAADDVNRTRSPFVLTCQQWITEGRYIVAAVNPAEVQWRMPQRSVAQKTRAGEILHVWKDRFRGTFYDEPQLTFNFQTGNIMPIRQQPLTRTGTRQVLLTPEPTPPGNTPVPPRDITITQVPRSVVDPSEREPAMPSGLDSFYNFLELVDEQKITSAGTVNFVYIIYNSRIFPNVTLSGLFTPDGVSWTDSANDPNQVSAWSANFTVYDSYPALNDPSALVNFFQSAGFGRV